MNLSSGDREGRIVDGKNRPERFKQTGLFQSAEVGKLGHDRKECSCQSRVWIGGPLRAKRTGDRQQVAEALTWSRLMLRDGGRAHAAWPDSCSER